VRRNSLRSLRELRSDKAPQARSTKRASRADPEAALLGAADIAAPPPGPRPVRHSRPPATRRPPGPLPNAALDTSVAHASRTGPLPANTTTVSARARPTARAKAGPRARATARLRARALGRRRASCAAEKRSRTGGARSAHRPSFSRRLSERSSRSERSEFRRASRCGEHRRAPPRSGGKHQARRRPRARALSRAVARARGPALARAVGRDFARAMDRTKPPALTSAPSSR
jgi:hypothetical protein